MSLSRWFRDYVYIPLGGNRGRTGRDLPQPASSSSLLTGLWHGANWTFLVWGLYHGALLLIEHERGTGEARRRRPVGACAGRCTFAPRHDRLGVLPGRRPRARRFDIAAGDVRAVRSGTSPTPSIVALTNQRTVTLLARARSWSSSRRPSCAGRMLDETRGPAADVARYARASPVAAPFAAMLVAAGTFSPFLYFQF